MPLHMRKSVRVGPYRFETPSPGTKPSVPSKVLGVRVSPLVHFISAGRNGFRYRATDPTTSLPESRTVDAPAITRSTYFAQVEMVEVDSGDVLRMRDEKFSAILDEINVKTQTSRLATILLVATIAVALVLSFTLEFGLIALAALALPLWFIGKWIDSYRRVTVLIYDLDARTEESFARLTEAFDVMMHCSAKWHIEAGGAVKDLLTWKQNAGASHLVQRYLTDLTYSMPGAIMSNLTPPALRVGRQIIYFFPDVALVQDGEIFGAVGYADLSMSWQFSNSIEHGQPPDDAVIIDYAWEHPNKNGGPDRRYRENRQLPVCCYEAMHISSASGINELVAFSRTGVVQAFASAMNSLPRQSLRDVTLALR